MQAEILLGYKEKKLTENYSETEKLKRKILNLQRIIDKRDSEVFVYYEQYKNGSISKSEFVSIKEKADTEAANAEKELLIFNEQLQNIKNTEYILSNDEFVHYQNRAEFKRLIADIKENKFKRLYIRDISRLTRNYMTVFDILQDIQNHSVEIVVMY